jgi:hypothetical protein
MCTPKSVSQLDPLGVRHSETSNLEFRNALDEYRQGHYTDCLVKFCKHL